MSETPLNSSAAATTTPPPTGGRSRGFRWPNTSASSSAFFSFLTSPIAGVVGLVAIITGLVLPPEGLGVPTCLFYAQSGLPCPGCGLTRSVTSFFHGKFLSAWDFNPFGVIAAALFVAMAIGPLLPRRLKERLVSRPPIPDRVMGTTVLLLVAGLLVHGAWRAYHAAYGTESRPAWIRNTIESNRAVDPPLDAAPAAPESGS